MNRSHDENDSSTAAANRLRFAEWDVRFTNPVCQLYSYGSDQNVVSVSGEKLTAKPKDVFCTGRDRAASAGRPEAPQTKLIEWIRDPSTTEIFIAYLTFSNQDVMQELCTAIKERNVKVRFVM